MRKYIYTLFLIGFIISGCSRNSYKAANKLYKQQTKKYAKELRAIPNQYIDSVSQSPDWVGTVNFNMRKPNFVIIHHTAMESCNSTVKAFTMMKSQVSAHYVICKDGIIHHMLNDYLRAWHAGIGKWGNISDINSVSIGIELDNNGYEPFSDPQINSLLHLLASLKRNYNIPAANFIGHSDIAPKRKNDPNVNFPWKKLAEKGFGYWYDDTTNVVLPPNFDNLQALRIIGYDIADSTAAIKAFKRHYLQQNNNGILTDEDKKVLYQVLKKNL